MSMTADGDVFDFFAGLDDLDAGRVRFVGLAAERIAEDYLRVLRFFRFHARYGRGTPDGEALAAIRAGVSGLARLSAERVWSEIKRILAGPDPAGTVALMRDCGVLAAVLPEAGDGAGLAALVAAGAPDAPVLRLAALIADDGMAAATRLRLSGAEAARLVALRATVAPPDDADDDDLRRALAGTAKDVLLGAAWLAGRGEPLRARLAAMRVPVFPLAGRDLAALGVPAGPAMGALLRDLRAWWLAGGCVADRAAARAELARRLAG
jgi:poly(A) polymerase/tRNA nucleotidyltransferase (CCA-adding enzyme)